MPTNDELDKNGPEKCPTCGSKTHPVCGEDGCNRRTMCPHDEPGEPSFSCEMCNAQDVADEAVSLAQTRERG